MSVRVMAWVFDRAPTNDPTDQLVLLAIADRCDDEGLSAYPSIATIARKTRLSERTVIRSTRHLQRSGILGVQPGHGPKGTNLYSVVMTPCQSVTPVIVSPLSLSHATPDTVSPLPCHRVTAIPDTVSPDPSGTSCTPGTSKREGLSLACKAEDLQALWNQVTSLPIPRCKELTTSRRRHSEARLRERGLDGMREVFTLIGHLPFCLGENDRGWRASFDWALKPANIAKVLEGNYVQQRRQHVGRTGAPPSGKYAAITESDEQPAERAS